MSIPSTHRFGPGLFLAALMTAVAASGLARAAPGSWSDALQKDPRLAAEVGWLETPQGKVLYLYRPNAARIARGAVILLHDLQTHADWPQVIRPLRENLPKHGWATLSLQLPPFDASAQPETYYQSVATRLTAALAFLGQQKDGPLMLIGTGTGASAGMWFLANDPKSAVAGMVALSLRPLPGQSPADSRALVAAVNQPVLEIFAQRDLPSVLAGIENRAPLAARQRPTSPAEGGDRPPARYRQLEVDGADAEYTDQADVLIKRIRGWMRLHIDR